MNKNTTILGLLAIIALIAIGFVALYGSGNLVLFPAKATSTPPQPTQVTTSQGTSYLQIVGGKQGLQLTPIRQDIMPIVENGSVVTSVFSITNTAKDYHQIGIMNSVVAAVRGPEDDPCNLSWNSPQADFPHENGPFQLLIEKTKRYKESRTFNLPGYYFVEPTKQGGDGIWGGLYPYPRIYFFVPGENAPAPHDSPCISR